MPLFVENLLEKFILKITNEDNLTTAEKNKIIALKDKKDLKIDDISQMIIGVMND